MRSIVVLALLSLLGAAGCAQLQKEAGTGLDNAAKVPENIWKSNKK